MIQENTIITTFDELRSRQDYLIVQANDLARSFGNLNAFEHQLLDYCFSYVKKDSQITDTFVCQKKEVYKHFGLEKSGSNHKRIAKAFKSLNERTALYFLIEDEDGDRGIRMGQLFSNIDFMESGRVKFRFSEFAAPYVFALKEKYYSFRLAELANIKNKYALILLKLWEANRYGRNRLTIIKGTSEEFQGWFLGEQKRLAPYIFKRDVLQKAQKELSEKLNAVVTINTIKNGKFVTGYEIQIEDTRISPFQ